MPRSNGPAPVGGSSWAGWGALAIIAVVVAAVLTYARTYPTPASRPAAPPVFDAAAARGFRADAWNLPDDDLLGFVEIPAGLFIMGSDPATDAQAFDNERWPGAAPARAMHLPAFYINRYEVTVAQFGAFVQATGHRVDERALLGAGNHPVSFVSWPDALAYCRWLETAVRSALHVPERIRGLLQNGWHVVLPSEAEWEKAARGRDGRIYPWGGGPRRDRANYASAAVTPVGSFQCPECAFPLSDMSGNVWEWTRSSYEPYRHDPSDGEKATEADALWVMRGGAFNDPARNVRAAIRGGADPGARRAFIGFRVAISPR